MGDYKEASAPEHVENNDDGCDHCDAMASAAKGLEWLSLAYQSFGARQDEMQRKWQQDKARFIRMVKGAKCLSEDVIEGCIQHMAPKISNKEFLSAMCEHLDATARMVLYATRLHQCKQFSAINDDEKSGLWKVRIGVLDESMEQ